MQGLPGPKDSILLARPLAASSSSYADHLEAGLGNRPGKPHPGSP